MTGRAWRDEEDEFMRASVRNMTRLYRGEMAEWIEGLAEWHLFATLTFDPLEMSGLRGTELEKARNVAAVPAVSTWTAIRRFQKWLDKSRVTVGRPTQGIVALERHQSGQPHGHGLLSIEGGLLYPDIVDLSGLWRSFPGNGYIRLEVPKSCGDVTRYAAKYMSKDTGDLVMALVAGGLTPRPHAEPASQTAGRPPAAHPERSRS